MKSICMARTLLALAAIAAAGISAAASGQFVEQPLPLPQIGPLAGGQSQVETVNVAPNDVPVLGFRFEGDVTGVSGTGSWASDLRLVITAPTGDVYDIGGFDNETNPWSFAGAGSTSDGFYSDERVGAFPFIDKEGIWTFEFTNDWSAGSPMTWNNVVITLLKGAPQPVDCPDDDPCPACTGDFDGNGVVDGGDLLTLLSCWGPVAAGCECVDIAGNDNVIDGGDLLALLSAWGSCPTADGGGGNVVIEDEPCGQDTNGGCNSDPPAFANLKCHDTVCGTAWAEGGIRDTDWYHVQVESKQRVKWTVLAEFPAQAIIVWTDPDCDDIHIVAAAQGVLPEVPFFVEACLQPGKPYALFVSPLAFDGMPCDGSGEYDINYVATVQCTDDPDCPKGACCFSKDNCQDDWDGIKCVVEGGQYGGDGSTCETFQCPFGACCLNNGACDKVTVQNCFALGGAYRGHGTQCEEPDICRDCAEGGIPWSNPDDVCDNNVNIDPYNGGCNYYPDEHPAWEQLCCGDQVSGEIWTLNTGGRDLDWRVLEIKEPMVLNLTLQHDFGGAGLEGIIFLAQANCPTTILASVQGPSPLNLFSLVDPGTYYVIVSSEFASVDAGTHNPCGSGNNGYTLSVSCDSQMQNVCAGQCGSLFISHPGFPSGTCSCSSDFCTPNGPQYCCPGICQHCDTGICDIDDCLNADDITANINGASVLGNNSTAAGEGALPPGSPSCQWQGLPQNVHNTVWYRFVAPANGAVTIETCGSSTPFQDSVLGLYTGTCGSLVEIGCGGDDCPAPDSPPYYSRIIATGLIPGETYYISLSNNGGWAGSTPGNYVLDITSP
jgi:hypothetical protein